MDNSPILRSKLKSDSASPLYFQLISVIKRYISAGLLRPGDLLPSEAEMVQAFSISRSTVRLAMGALEEEGLVIRQRGRGTYVAEPKMRRKTADLWSFTSEVQAMGLEPSSTLVEFEIIQPADDIVALLELFPRNAPVYKFTRIRRVGSEPVMLETTFSPTYLHPDLKRQMLEVSSFYSLLSEKGFSPYTALDSYEAVRFSAQEAALLGCKSGSVGFAHQRSTRTQSGQVIELTQSLIRGDRVKLDITLQRDSVTFARSIDGQQP